MSRDFVPKPALQAVALDLEPALTTEFAASGDEHDIIIAVITGECGAPCQEGSGGAARDEFGYPTYCASPRVWPRAA